MPAERTRESPKRGHSASVELPQPNEITFATNLTPVTFNDPPPMVDQGESTLFPDTDDGSSPPRPTHTRKKPEDHIPRPPNAFILFRSSFVKSQHVSTGVETNHSTLSKIIGLTWKNLPDDERQIWHAKAKSALEEHRRKFPKYSFRPLHGKAKGGPEKRRVREVGPKDLKRCAKIAELLVEGKKGAELDAAVQEFDRHHVPEIVTRFEDPITEQMYRRSSSAPAEDPDSRKFVPSKSVSPRKVRASSSQPRPRSYPTSPSPLSHEMGHSHSISLPSYEADMFSLPLKSESPLDYNTFSFDHVDSAMPMYEPDYVPTNNGGYQPPQYTIQYDQSQVCDASGLSLDLSFMENWTRCSTPSSTQTSMPATPLAYYNTPLVDNDDPFSPTSNCDYHKGRFFELSPEQNLQPALGLESNQHVILQPFPTYPANAGFDPATYNFSSSNIMPSFEGDPPRPQLTPLDAEFSQFMASLPSYAA